MVGIATTYRPVHGTYLYPLFVSLLFFVHSRAVDRLSQDRLDFVVFNFMLEGVADQYVAGHYFQPSAFGVLLVASIWAYLRGRPVLAAILAVAASAVHPTYSLPAFALMLVYLFELIRQDRHLRRALVVAGVAALMVLPSFAYPLTRVLSAPPDVRAEANRIMVEVRVPHHAVPRNWFGWDDVARIALIAAALILVRRTRLFPILAVLTAIGAGLTAIQILSGSNELALAFPWRVSSVLVPIATAVILAAVVSRITTAVPDPGVNASRKRMLTFGLAATIVGLVVLGGAIQIERDFTSAAGRKNLGVTRFLTEEVQAPEIVLVPPLGFTEFRLESGLPIVVNWKAVTWTPPEILEWHRRFQDVSALYDEGFDCDRVLATAVTYDAEWVVWPEGRWAERKLAKCSGLVKEYADRSYVALRVSREN